MTKRTVAFTIAGVVAAMSLVVVLITPMLTDLGLSKRSDADYLRMFSEVVAIVKKCYGVTVDDK
jgi:hypothetical protein